ncbi:EamA family transporter [Longispora fulva]|uniref:Inner membrane transporter RhtA n=1 Tax=Longispora fulva TaxID=619741 RepID=A0A8J7GTN4_9ACTN|nr:EamA family transporter [Longispora fulva]MBG6138284.1 inner membrane transporter RhtA [Longispora fulva]
MTSATATAARGPAVGFALASMAIIQVGAAVSTSLFATIGPAGTSWLRLAWAAVVFVAIARPKVWRMRAADLGTAVVLGLVSAGTTLLFFEAVARLPLATAVAVEFLGPLAVGLLRPGGRAWPVLAFGGVLLVTQPWRGTADLVGIGFALGAAACWGAYILLTQRVADAFGGIEGLAVSMPAAAVFAAFFGAPAAWPHLDLKLLLTGLVLALLLPVLPYTLELLALRRLTTSAFGTLMSLEPAFALVVGAAVLHQIPGLVQGAGIALVTAASLGAARSGAREGQ